MDIHDLNFEVEKLESTEGIDSALAATATLHKDWLDIKVSVRRGLSNLFSSGRAQKENWKSRKHFKFIKHMKHWRSTTSKVNQGKVTTRRPDPYFLDLKYRRTVHQQRQNQKQFLNSIPDRVQVKSMLFVRVLIDLQLQEYGTKYWTAVRDVGMVMESFANYLRYF